jgi:hypothetical protein
MLRIEMLPARNGDALWIEYGDPQSPRRVIVDGGTEGSYEGGLRARIDALAPEERSFELLVVTHIDSDHIAGALALLRDETLGATFGDVWFNAWRHLPDTLEGLGPVEGELLTQTILQRGLAWNDAFDGKAVVRPAAGKLPHVELADGLGITVLAPAPEQLAELRPVWRRPPSQRSRPGMPVPEPVDEPPPPGLDTSGLHRCRNPRSSVFASRHCGGERLQRRSGCSSTRARARSHWGRVPVRRPRGRNRLLERDGGPRPRGRRVKVPHSREPGQPLPALVAALDCDRHLFSSNGTNTKHPHPEAVARTISGTGQGSTLYFNYSTRFTEPWADDELEEQHGYDAVYPDDGEAGLKPDLGDD